MESAVAHPLQKCLLVREFFIGLLSRLNFESVANLFAALPVAWREQAFPSTIWYATHVAPKVRSMDAVGLRPESLNFPDFMAFWHMAEHAIDIRIRAEHAILRANFNFAVDTYGRGRLLGPPLPRGSKYSALVFLPSTAPKPFQNSLWVCQTPSNDVKIYSPGAKGLKLVGEFAVASGITSFAVSPLGTTVLLLNDVYKMSLVRLEEYSLQLRITQMVVPSGETFKNSVFVDENSFIARDRNWTFWLYTHSLDTNAFQKRVFHIPDLLFPTTVTRSGKRMFRSFPDMSRVGLGSFLYLPAAAEGRVSDCLVMAEFCCTLGVDRRMKHPSLCHVLQLSVDPGGRSAAYYFVLENGLITDYIADHERRSIFVVGLTWANEMCFRTFPPHATRAKPSHCTMIFDVPHMTSLCVYRIRMSDFVDLPGSVCAEPLFYAPSDKRQLVSPPGGGPSGKDETRFSRTYSLRSDWYYRAFACRRYLCVSQSPTIILCFSFAAKKNAPPFEISMEDSIDVRTLACTEEMFIIAGLPGPNESPPIKICVACPHHADLFQVEIREATRLESARIYFKLLSF